MLWLIDHAVKLSTICEGIGWNRLAVKDYLQIEEGMSPADAEAYTAFAFCEHAKVRDCKPEDYLTDEQWERLSIQ